MTLLNLLKEFTTSPFWVAENQDAFDKIISFIETHLDTCFNRTNLEGHVTGSAFVVKQDLSECLLMHHKKLNLWVQFGGHADGNPDIAEVAAREALEESGIEGLTFASPGIFDIDVHSIPARGNEPEHFHYDIRFLMLAPKGAHFVQNDESNALRWFKPKEVRHVTHASAVLRMVEKWERLKKDHTK